MTSGAPPRANAVGGSHAQRDIIDLTLIAAAARAGDDGLARALVTERAARKPLVMRGGVAGKLYPGSCGRIVNKIPATTVNCE